MRDGREELVLHPVGELFAAQQVGALLEIGAQLELTAPAAERDRDGARENEPAHRTLEDRDVAERTQHGERALAGRGELAAGQDDDRDVGPRRLLIEAVDQGSERRGAECFFRHQQRPRFVGNRSAQIVDAVADHGVDAFGLQHLDRELRVAPDRRQHADALTGAAHCPAVEGAVLSP